MERIEIYIKHKPRKNDIAIFDGEKWVVVNFTHLLKDIYEFTQNLNEKVSIIEEDIKKIKGE